MKKASPKYKMINRGIGSGPVSRHTYTVKEIQELLKISRATSYELVNSGVFPVVRIGKAIRIPAKTFNEWLYQKNTAAS